MDDQALKVVLRCYEMADRQVGVSLKQRDGIILLYLGTAAALAGTALAKGAPEVSLLLLIPPLSTGAALLAMLHHVRIGAISTFRLELHEILRTETSDSLALPSLLDSQALLERLQTRKLLPRRLSGLALQLNQVLAHGLLVLGPSLGATVLFALATWRTAGFSKLADSSIISWTFGMRIAAVTVSGLFIVSSLAVIGLALAVRRDLYLSQEFERA